MDALELLRHDHSEAEDLLRQLETTNGLLADRRRRDAFVRLRDALRLHAKVEEEVFYPALRRAGADARLLDHSYEEHGRADRLLARMDAEQGDWDDNLSYLADAVRGHVREEEEELFPEAERALGEEGLRELGRRMEGLKREASSGG